MGDFQSVSNVLVKKEDLYGVLFLTLDRKLKMTCVKVGKFVYQCANANCDKNSFMAYTDMSRYGYGVSHNVIYVKIGWRVPFCL